MLNETRLSLRGNVATEPTLSVTSTGTTVCSFRLAVTTRRFSQVDGSVVDAESSFYTVTCWRTLADHVAASVTKGQGVLVQGRLRVRDFTHEGQPRTSADVTADAVGHDLQWGTSVLTPKWRPRAEADRGAERTEGSEPVEVDRWAVPGGSAPDAGPAGPVGPGASDDAEALDTGQDSADREVEPAF